MINITNERDKRREAAAQDRMFRSFERTLERQMFREFTRTAREASKRYSQTLGNDLAALAVIEQHQVRVFRIIRATYDPVIRTMAARVFDAADGLKSTAPDEHKDRMGDIDRLVNDYIFSVGLDHSTTIAQTSKKALRRILADGADAGLGEIEIAKNLSKSLGGTLGRFRSEMIARTEVHSSAMSSSLTSANSLNLTLLKEWVPVDDDRTRESHMEMANHPAIDPEQAFNVNGSAMMFPSDPNGAPAESINCRCILIYQEKFAA